MGFFMSNKAVSQSISISLEYVKQYTYLNDGMYIDLYIKQTNHKLIIQNNGHYYLQIKAALIMPMQLMTSNQ